MKLEGIWEPRAPVAEPIELYRGPIGLGTKPALWGDGRVSIEWRDGPQVQFQVAGRGEAFDVEGDGQFALGDGRTLSGAAVMWEYAKANRVRLTGTVEPTGFATAPRMSEVRTQLVNFPLVNRDRTWLMVDNWRVYLDDMGIGGLDWPGDPTGFFITQNVVITRESNRSFTPDEVLGLLEALVHFASITRGAWVGHLNATGLNRAGRQVWEYWATSRTDSSERGRRWGTDYYPPHPSDTEDTEDDETGEHDWFRLQDLWRGFYALWESADLRGTIRALTSLYIEASAHTAGEAGLVISVVVLELLSWAIVVNDRRMLSAEGHDRLAASDRLRLLLSVVGASGAYPADGLDALSKAGKWTDGPHAVMEVRNALVHPAKRQRLQTAPAVADEALGLALGYAERAMEWWLRSAGQRRLNTEPVKGRRA